jgi:hypothetical protein
MLQEQNFAYVEEPYELGEVGFHSGWTFTVLAAIHHHKPVPS